MRQIWHHSIYTITYLSEYRKETNQGSGLGQTFSLDCDSRGYPIVALSFQRVRFVHLGIIHGNQQDRNSGGEITSRIDFRDGEKSDGEWFALIRALAVPECCLPTRQFALLCRWHRWYTLDGKIVFQFIATGDDENII